MVVLSRADLIAEPDRRAIRVRAEKAAKRPLPWAEVRQAPIGLTDDEGRSHPLDGLAGTRVAAFCGIGNPEGFRRTLLGRGIDLVDFRTFPDHHPYSRADAADLARWVQTTPARLALTTQKDLVKLPIDRLGPVPLRALRIGLEPLDGLAALEEALGALLGRII
jgi:tetraacyldisaccharide 4'-kinase